MRWMALLSGNNKPAQNDTAMIDNIFAIQKKHS